MKKKNSWIKTELPSMFLLFLGIFAVRSSLADHYYVPSGSMEYALMGGDRVLVSKAAYGLRIPFTRIEVVGGQSVSRGDVVIFDSPRDGTRLIKRIVGIGGDTISLKNGHLFLDGQSLADDFEAVELFDNHVAPLNLEDGGGPDIESLSIPAGMLLAIGDHRGSSLDGRYFGLVQESDIYGKALGVYRRRDEGFVWRSL
jgi:signal peptidase I